jgi:hypothetical protein
MSPPGSSPRASAKARSAAFGYEMPMDRKNALSGLRRSIQ